jgi:hemoglobin-like flavoprotein
MENALFEASYRRIFGKNTALGESSDEFFEEFYIRFLAQPEIRELFKNTDMKRQAAMLRKSFFVLAGFYVTSLPSGEMERLGLIHARLGVSPKYYDQWLDALVATVRALDPEADLATEMAWRWALTPGITFMRLYDYFYEP